MIENRLKKGLGRGLSSLLGDATQKIWLLQLIQRTIKRCIAIIPSVIMLLEICL